MRAVIKHFNLKSYKTRGPYHCIVRFFERHFQFVDQTSCKHHSTWENSIIGKNGLSLEMAPGKLEHCLRVAISVSLA